MQRLTKKIALYSTLLIVGFVTHFSSPTNSPYRQNQGLKTEAAGYSQETCRQSCTINLQGEHNRATATLSLLDSSSSSIPPGSLVVVISTAVIAIYYFLYVSRRSYRQILLQQEFCIWRF